RRRAEELHASGRAIARPDPLRAHHRLRHRRAVLRRPGGQRRPVQLSRRRGPHLGQGLGRGGGNGLGVRTHRRHRGVSLVDARPPQRPEDEAQTEAAARPAGRSARLPRPRRGEEPARAAEDGRLPRHADEARSGEHRPVTAPAALVFDGTGFNQVELAQAKAAIGQAPLVWIDAEGRSPELDGLLSALQLHPLTVEDVFETGTTPKIEDFGKYLYIRAHGVVVPAGGATRLEKEELDIVLGPGWLFTHHAPALKVPAQVREGLLRSGKPVDAPRIAHLLLDRLVD